MNSKGADFATICRLCLNKSNKLWDLFDGSKDRSLELGYQLNAVTSLEIFTADEMPNKICTVCKRLLQMSYKFKQYCKQSDTNLTIFKCTGKKPEPVEIPEDLKKLTQPPKPGEAVGSSKPKCATANAEVQTDHEENHKSGTIVEAMENGQTNRYTIVDKLEENDMDFRVIDPTSESFSYRIIGSSGDGFVKDENLTIEPVKILNQTIKKPLKKPPAGTQSYSKVKPKILNKVVGPPLQLNDPKINYNANGAIELVTDIYKEDEIEMAAEPVQTNVFPCSQCERSFPLQQLLEIHLLNHSRLRDHACPYCDKKFFSKYDLAKHNLTHTGERPYECVVCQKSFSRSTLLTRHEKTHTDVEKIQCVQCDRQFLKEDEYTKHVERHNKRRPFPCHWCTKRFAFKQGLERHLVNHEITHPHQCQYCDLSFPSAGKLQRHVTKHAGNRPYPCKLCNKSFLLSHHLSRHMRGYHQKDPTACFYKCADCGKDFDSLNIFVDHVAVHAVESSACPMCKEKLGDLNEVDKHIKLHVSLKQHNCDYCDLMFLSEEDLDRHCIKSHANEMCTVIPIHMIPAAAGDPAEDDETIEEFIVDELELKPISQMSSALASASTHKRPSKRKEPSSTANLDPAAEEEEDDSYYVVLDETESDMDLLQPMPAKIMKIDSYSSSVQKALSKVSKGVTIKKDPNSS